MLKQLKWLGAVACFGLLLAACGNGTKSGSTGQYTALGSWRSECSTAKAAMSGAITAMSRPIRGGTVSLTNLGVNGARSF